MDEKPVEKIDEEKPCEVDPKDQYIADPRLWSALPKETKELLKKEFDDEKGIKSRIFPVLSVFIHIKGEKSIVLATLMKYVKEALELDPQEVLVNYSHAGGSHNKACNPMLETYPQPQTPYDADKWDIWAKNICGGNIVPLKELENEILETIARNFVHIKEKHFINKWIYPLSFIVEFYFISPDKEREDSIKNLCMNLVEELSGEGLCMIKRDVWYDRFFNMPDGDKKYFLHIHREPVRVFVYDRENKNILETSYRRRFIIDLESIVLDAFDFRGPAIDPNRNYLKDSLMYYGFELPHAGYRNIRYFHYTPFSLRMAKTIEGRIHRKIWDRYVLGEE